MLSILGILISAQQVAVLDLLGSPQTPRTKTISVARYTTNNIKNKSPLDDVGRYLPLLLTEAHHGDGGWRPRWKMVFIWQCPIMFMGYAVCAYLAGLTIYVCTPLIRGNKVGEAVNVSLFVSILGVLPPSLSFCFRQALDFIAVFLEERLTTETSKKIAWVYLAASALFGSLFLFCSFWVYHYIDLKTDLEDVEDEKEVLDEIG